MFLKTAGLLRFHFRLPLHPLGYRSGLRYASPKLKKPKEER